MVGLKKHRKTDEPSSGLGNLALMRTRLDLKIGNSLLRSLIELSRLRRVQKSG